jgi:gas vesicle protein
VARDAGGFLAGFFTGALVGASLAMVLAPASGEETRDLLRAKAREASDRVADSATS